MAQKFLKRARKLLSKPNWQESYATFVLGAIIVIVLGLLVANFFGKKGKQIDSGEQTTQAEITQTQEYKVVQDDSLSAISKQFYGSDDFWPVLAKENKIVNPNLIYVDATLKVPSKEEAGKIKTQMTQTSYQVKEGDTLFKIATEVYGDGSKWPVLDRVNGSRRLPNGNPLIFAGSTIVIPR
ncbi:LysM peptidoglycan-binding domain-containing protein [Candidatus Curtissbacteria bacterium]|nr:LysM peptidoglycan-binding domain-containing protein [Candidatus Curtissbacteria bacterium]